MAGLILWFSGWRMMRSLAFPWIFLAFIWPMLPLEEGLVLPVFWYEGAGVSAATFHRHIVIGLRHNLLHNLELRWGMLSFFATLPPKHLPAELEPIEAETKIAALASGK